MPAEQRGRRDQEDTPPLPAEQAGQAGQHSAVSGGVPRSCHLAAQYGQLMAEHGYLDVLLVRRRAQPQQVKEPAHEQEGDRTSHAEDLARSRSRCSKPRSYECTPHAIHDDT